MHGLWKGGAAVSDTYDFGACVLQVREIDRLRARIAVLEAALRDVCSDVAISRFTSVEQARRALAEKETP